MEMYRDIRKILFKTNHTSFLFLRNREKTFEETNTFKRDWRGKEKLVARYIKRTRRISWRTRFVPEYRAIFNRASLYRPINQYFMSTLVRSFSLFFFLSFKIKFRIASFPTAGNSRNGTMTDSFPDPFCLQFLDNVSKPYFIDRFRDAMDYKGRLRVKLSDAI